MMAGNGQNAAESLCIFDGTSQRAHRGERRRSFERKAHETHDAMRLLVCRDVDHRRAACFRRRAGWLAALFLGEMLTASAMQHFEGELEKAVVLTLFIPLIMSSGGNSGSQATSLIIRALAIGELKLSDWWRVALRELPTPRQPLPARDLMTGSSTRSQFLRS